MPVQRPGTVMDISLVCVILGLLMIVSAGMVWVVVKDEPTDPADSSAASNLKIRMSLIGCLLTGIFSIICSVFLLFLHNWARIGLMVVASLALICSATLCAYCVFGAYMDFTSAGELPVLGGTAGIVMALLMLLFCVPPIALIRYLHREETRLLFTNDAAEAP